MTNSFSPPIVEAVVDINCDLPPSFDLSKLLPAARDAYRETYPQFRNKIHLHTEFQDTGESQEITKAERSVDAIQFYSEDSKQLCQIRRNGFSFNRLAPYTQFSDYQSEIFRTWDLFKNFAKPISIKNVQMRYINRIPIPCGDSPVSLDEYFTTVPELPDEMGLQHHECFARHVTSDPQTGEVVVLVFAVEPFKDNLFSVLLDINVVSNYEIRPEDTQGLEKALKSLRNLKNRVFGLTLTPKCHQLLSKPAS